MSSKETFVFRDIPIETLPDELRVPFPVGVKVRVTIETYTDAPPVPSMRIIQVGADGVETERTSDTDDLDRLRSGAFKK